MHQPIQFYLRNPNFVLSDRKDSRHTGFSQITSRVCEHTREPSHVGIAAKAALENARPPIAPERKS